MSAPWLKFYTSDWRADPALRMCSLAARGLWMEMLCVMHEAEPYGSLLVNGQIVTHQQLAGLAGSTLREITKYLGEMEAAGVFSKDEGGTIYSRRMRRDRERAERDKANGKGGGNPGLKGGVNPRDNGGDKAQIPDTRIQNQKEEDYPADAGPTSNCYAFESGIIRLNQRDFDRWKANYTHLDLGAELLGVTEWANQQGPQRWFNACQGLLAKKNREAKANAESAKNAPAFKWKSGIEGVI